MLKYLRLLQNPEMRDSQEFISVFVIQNGLLQKCNHKKASCGLHPDRAEEQLVLEYVFYLSAEKLIFPHCLAQIFIT